MTTENVILILQAVILFIGLRLTAISVRNAKNDNRKMATIDLILREQGNQELNQAIAKVYDLVHGVDFPSLHIYLDKEKSPNERKAIITMLNYREFVAVGINTGIIDEEIYKRSYYNIILRDWKLMCKTIEAIRNSEKGHQSNFKEFETLVKRWSQIPLQINTD